MALDDDKTRTHVTLTSGTVISHYRIIEKIGAGGMGEVYLAEDVELDRRVALKFLPLHLCQDADCRARFKREAQAAARLSHPNIVDIHEVAEHGGRPYLVMEYLQGKTLKELIGSGDLPLQTAVDLTIHLCEGLSKAHRAEIIHRDIKPANIIVTSDGAKILDFGLASIKGADKITKTGATIGTVNYMSPEQTCGDAMDQRSDVFSLGVVLYEMITGQLPFKGERELAVIRAIGQDEPEPLARYKRGVSDELQRIVSKALAKDKNLRYQHADDLAVDLRTVNSSVSSALGSLHREKRVLGLSAAVLVVMVIALVLNPWRLGNSSDRHAVAADNRVAIMDFENLEDKNDSLRLGKKARTLFTTTLSQSDYLKIVSSERLYDIQDSITGVPGLRDPSIARRIAKQAQAKWMVIGTIHQTKPDMVIYAELTDCTTDVISSSGVKSGRPDEMSDLIGQFAKDFKYRLEQKYVPPSMIINSLQDSSGYSIKYK